MAAPGQRLRGRLLQLEGNPSGSERADPGGQAEAGPGPCAQRLPLVAPGPWVAGQHGLPPGGGQGPWVAEAGPSRSSSPHLAAVACFQAATDWSPIASMTPTPAVVMRDFPAHKERLQGTGPAPWALSPGSPLGDGPASKTPEEARPGQCAKSQHLRSCARTDGGSGDGRDGAAGPSRAGGGREPPLIVPASCTPAAAPVCSFPGTVAVLPGGSPVSSGLGLLRNL